MFRYAPRRWWRCRCVCLALLAAWMSSGVGAIDFTQKPFLTLPVDPRCSILFDEQGRQMHSRDGCLVADCGNGTFLWRSVCHNVDDLLDRCLVSLCLPGGRCVQRSFCDDGNECTIDQCEEGSVGECVYTMRPDGSRCGGGDGSCESGICRRPDPPQPSLTERMVSGAMLLLTVAVMFTGVLIALVFAYWRTNI